MPRRKRSLPLALLLIGVVFFASGLMAQSAEMVGIGITALALSLVLLRQDRHALIDAAERDRIRAQRAVDLKNTEKGN